MAANGNGRSRLRIPARWQFTPEQLTPIIAARHPGARLSRVSQLDGSDGTMSRAMLGLEYAEDSKPVAAAILEC